MERSFDALLTHHVGDLGFWQISLFLLILTTSNPPLFKMQQIAFLTPPHSCAQPHLLAVGWTAESVRDITVPTDASCRQYNFSVVDYNISTINNQSAVIACQHGWTFDNKRSYFKNSVSVEFNLVCEHQLLLALAGAAFTIGMIPGSSIAGYLSDRFGRRNVCMITCLLSAGAAAVTGLLSMNVMLFTFFRFLSGIMTGASVVTGYILCAELTTTKHQNTVAFLSHIMCNGVLDCYYLLAAYLLQDWRWLHIATGVINLFALLFPILVPESPRWLLAKKKSQAALVVLQRAQTVNKRCRCKPLPEAEDIKLTSEALLGNNSATCGDVESHPSNENIIWTQLFTNRLYFVRLACLLYLWTASVCVTFGLLFYSVRLQANPYLVAGIISLTSIGSIALKAVVCSFFGFRRPLIAFLISMAVLTSTAVPCLALWPDHLVTVSLASMAVIIGYASNNTLYSVSPTLFPTGLRNLAIGLLYGFCRCGMAVAVLVQMLDSLTGCRYLPMLVFAALMVTAVLVAVLLPFEREKNERKSADGNCDKAEEDGIAMKFIRDDENEEI